MVYNCYSVVFVARCRHHRTVLYTNILAIREYEVVIWVDRQVPRREVVLGGILLYYMAKTWGIDPRARHGAHNPARERDAKKLCQQALGLARAGACLAMASNG